MTGSPVFKFNPNSSKKQKIQRKLNFFRDVPKNQRLLHIDNILDEISDHDESLKEKPFTESLNASSFSSFVFDHKKGVKRKLDFDADDASDEMVSYKFSSKNISLCGFQSKNSSLADVKSITLTPNKRRFRGSYSRSSVTSTCRRRLFAEHEQRSKKSKLESPVLGQKMKKKEVKLSVKKRFPGVPNSDNARSGLLLNLAFSKYNLSNAEKPENVSVDFVDGASKTTKKDFIQYSSIKKNDSSFIRSPVFMAIRKVKRKLDLEEQDSSSRGNTETNKNEASTKTENPRTVAKANENTKLNADTQKQSTVLEIDHSGHNEHRERHLEPKNHISSPLSVRTQRNNKCRSDLFKNSKLRSTLRDEIFNLSKTGKDEGDRVPDLQSENSPVLEKKRLLSHKRRRSNDLKTVFEDLKNKPKKYDRIIVKKALAPPDKISSIGERTSNSNSDKFSRQTANKNAKKWIEDSFGKRQLDKVPNLRRSLFEHKREVFMEMHMQRFLKDCIEAVGQGINGETLPDDGLPNIETDTALTEFQNKSSEKVDDLNVANENALGNETALQNKESTKKIEQTNFTIENVDSKEGCRKKDSDLVIETESQEMCDLKRVNDLFTNAESQDANIQCSQHSDRTLSERGFIIENAESQDNDAAPNKTDFVIENATSQEINEQCVEEVELFIENVNSQDTFLNPAKNDRCDTNSISQGSEQNSVCGCVLPPYAEDPDLQVEEVPSPESVSVDYQFVEWQCADSTPVRSDTNSKNDTITFDSVKKRRRKKYSPESLLERLEKLIIREKSNVRMWEYESSKKPKQEHRKEPATFCVRKMWKEFSRLVLLCSFVDQDNPSEIYNLDKVKDFGISISNLVMIIMEPTYCPRMLTYSSIFRVYPPWEIFYTEKFEYVAILRPCKVEIISKDGIVPFYKDPTLPNDPKIIEGKNFCDCKVACDCTLPEGYQTVIQPLLLSNSNLFNLKSYSRLKNYNAEDFKSIRSIGDVVLKHKLYSSEYLYLDLRVLHIHKSTVCDAFSFWHIICVDAEREICCIIVDGAMKSNLSNVNKEVVFRFFGILPWKLIPAKSVSSFIEHVQFPASCSDQEKLGASSLYVFVMSDKHGRVGTIKLGL